MTRQGPILMAGAVLVVAAGLAAAAQQPVFRASADAVTVDVSITVKNKPLTGLDEADFELTDNGVAQKILDIGHETTPIDLTFILDTSGQFRRALVQAVGTVRTVLRPDDRVSLVTFDRRVQQPITLAAPDALGSSTVTDLATSPLLFFGTSLPALYDALVLALPSQPILARRQMAMLLASAPDATSFTSEEDALDVAHRASTAIFVVGAELDTRNVPLKSPPPGSPARSLDPAHMVFGAPAPPRDFLKTLAADTGGLFQPIYPWGYRVYTRTRVELGPTDEDLDTKFVRALNEFRSSYTLRYIPQGVSRTGWHELKVRVTKPDIVYQVRARRGYAGQGLAPGVDEARR